MVEDKIFNSSFDNVEYGVDRTTQSPIAISPFASSRYDDTTSEEMEDVYENKRMMEIMEKLYEESDFYDKYQGAPKKIERRDMGPIYYYFKNKLKDMEEFTIIQIFCTIAEFFDMNYRTLYRDVISLDDKAEILEMIEENYGMDEQLNKSKKLF